MKKLIFLLVIGLLLVSLPGCQDDALQNSSSNPPPTSEIRYHAYTLYQSGTAGVLYEAYPDAEYEYPPLMHEDYNSKTDENPPEVSFLLNGAVVSPQYLRTSVSGNVRRAIYHVIEPGAERSWLNVEVNPDNGKFSTSK